MQISRTHVIGPYRYSLLDIIRMKKINPTSMGQVTQRRTRGVEDSLVHVCKFAFGRRTPDQGGHRLDDQAKIALTLPQGSRLPLSTLREIDCQTEDRRHEAPAKENKCRKKSQRALPRCDESLPQANGTRAYNDRYAYGQPPWSFGRVSLDVPR